MEKRTSNHLNSYTKSNMFDPSDQSTPKINRMLTRHQLVVQQTSPKKIKNEKFIRLQMMMNLFKFNFRANK